MQHCTLTVAPIKRNGLRMTGIVMRNENDLSFVARASSDGDLCTGLFLLYNTDAAGDNPDAVLSPSLSGLTYTLRSAGGKPLATITVCPSWDPARPIRLSVSVHRFDQPKPPNPLASLLPTSCMLYSSLGEDDTAGMGHNHYQQPFASQQVDELVTRAALWNSETRCWLQNLGSRVKRMSNRNLVLISKSDGTRSVLEDLQHVHLRFGQLTAAREWVCDFREPSIDKTLALAVVCAALAQKALCAL